MNTKPLILFVVGLIWANCLFVLWEARQKGRRGSDAHSPAGHDRRSLPIPPRPSPSIEEQAAAYLANIWPDKADELVGHRGSRE